MGNFWPLATRALTAEQVSRRSRSVPCSSPNSQLWSSTTVDGFMRTTVSLGPIATVFSLQRHQRANLLWRDSRAEERLPWFVCSAGQMVPRPAMRGFRASAVGSGVPAGSGAASAPLAALSRCEPRNGRRPAPELSGTLGRSRGSELCGPAFATSRYSGRVGRVDAGADDGTTLGGGEGEGSPRLHYVTCIELTAIIADGARGSSGGSSGAGCRFPAPGARAGVCGCSTI